MADQSTIWLHAYPRNMTIHIAYIIRTRNFWFIQEFESMLRAILPYYISAHRLNPSPPNGLFWEQNSNYIACTFIHSAGPLNFNLIANANRSNTLKAWSRNPHKYAHISTEYDNVRLGYDSVRASTHIHVPVLTRPLLDDYLSPSDNISSHTKHCYIATS
jgi:hypothetical protein